jgi:ABC-type branched-subunit amino acid transport system ATPase component
LVVGLLQFVGVIGANGAGKTSLLMALSGAVRASGGNVTSTARMSPTCRSICVSGTASPLSRKDVRCSAL